MDSNPKLLFAIFLACLIVWQLAAGYTFGRSRAGGAFRDHDRRKNWFKSLFWADVFREHNPRKYWFTILAEIVVLVIFLVTGATSWEWSSSSQERENEQEEVVAAPTRAEQRRAAAHADVVRACELGKAEACDVAERIRTKP